jgi:TonB family protein
MTGPRRSRSGVASLVASLSLHAALIGSGAWFLARSLGGPASTEPAAVPREVDVSVATPDIELPAMTASGLHGAPDPRARPRDEPSAGGGGGEREPRPDMHRDGRGGSDESSDRALNLADAIDGLMLDRDPLNRLDRSQVQRLDTGDWRRSHDNRRATPNPMELSFLATGPGKLAERRPPAHSNPSRGSLDGTHAESLGGQLGGSETEPGSGAEPEAGGALSGGERRRTGAGAPSSAHGSDYRLSAAVALARPFVTQGRAAVPAPERGRPEDTLDSTQEVANAVQSLIQASAAGGRRGTGLGGQAGPGAPGSGGPDGPGSRSAANGYGPGAPRSAGDPRQDGYFHGISRKLAPHWRDAFPEWAIAEGRSGLAKIAFSIGRDGAVSNVRIARSSGISEFDANVVRAIHRAGPFDPPPAVFGRTPLAVTITFDALNPAVGREGPGKGRRR